VVVGVCIVLFVWSYYLRPEEKGVRIEILLSAHSHFHRIDQVKQTHAYKKEKKSQTNSTTNGWDSTCFAVYNIT
jgi:hypothetical protein